MAKFKVGDVCEIIENSPNQPAICAGCECTIISLQSQWPGNISIEIHGFPSGHKFGWACPPEKLRLKRPPSWDKWIYDTSDIDVTSKETA